MEDILERLERLELRVEELEEELAGLRDTIDESNDFMMNNLCLGSPVEMNPLDDTTNEVIDNVRNGFIND